MTKVMTIVIILILFVAFFFLGLSVNIREAKPEGKSSDKDTDRGSICVPYSSPNQHSQIHGNIVLLGLLCL